MRGAERRDAWTVFLVAAFLLSPHVSLALPPSTPRVTQAAPLVSVGDETHYRVSHAVELIDTDEGKISAFGGSGFQVDLSWKVLSISGVHYELSVSYTAAAPASISRSVDVTLDPLTMNVSGPRSPAMHSFLWTLPGRQVGDAVLLGGNASSPIQGQVTWEANQFTPQGTQPVFMVDARLVEFFGYTFPLLAMFDSDTGLDLGAELNTDGAFFQAGFIFATPGFTLVSTTINLGPANWLADIVYFLGTNLFTLILLAVAGSVGAYFYVRWRRTYREMVADRLAEKRARSRGRGHGKS